jgi:hypothetical protein
MSKMSAIENNGRLRVRTRHGDESRMIAEISKISGYSPEMVSTIVNLLEVVMLTDISVKGYANTILGKVRLQNGELSVVSPNPKLGDFDDPQAMLERLLSEFSSDA